jgi:hypothetical protein
MRSTIHLFNTALGRLGGEQLPLNRSPREGGTTGQLCENLFPHVLDMTLAAHAWGFAVKRLELSSPLDRGTENPEYRLAYALPSDCVKPLRLEGHEGMNRRPAYVIEGRTLRRERAGAVLVYVARVDDPLLWPPAFADALAWALAGELASARLNDSRKQQWCLQNYKIALADAAALDQAAQNPRPPWSAWNEARLGEGVW